MLTKFLACPPASPPWPALAHRAIGQRAAGDQAVSPQTGLRLGGPRGTGRDATDRYICVSETLSGRSPSWGLTNSRNASIPCSPHPSPPPSSISAAQRAQPQRDGGVATASYGPGLVPLEQGADSSGRLCAGRQPAWRWLRQEGPSRGDLNAGAVALAVATPSGLAGLAGGQRSGTGEQSRGRARWRVSAATTPDSLSERGGARGA